MEKMTLGKTGIEITRTGFGALPIQRVDFDTARKILRKAYDSGITFFDTANFYTNSEEKIGYSLSDVRENIIIATKSGGRTKKEVWEHINLSLKRLNTDYIDLLQLHNPEILPDPNDKNSSYQALIEAKEKGIIRHIGITLHKYTDALKAVESGFYETLQYPLSAVSSQKELEIINLCKETNTGLIAMKALCGGVITNAKMAFAFLRQFENVVPIWGIQKEHELDEIMSYESIPPKLDEGMLALIESERKELAGEFCRGCGYCMPCPVGIPLSLAARMYYMLRRGPSSLWTGKEWQEKMAKIEDCTNCGACRKKCPYKLDTPSLIKKMYKDYKTFL
jgi:uncharacterized protein